MTILRDKTRKKKESDRKSCIQAAQTSGADDWLTLRGMPLLYVYKSISLLRTVELTSLSCGWMPQ